MKPLIFVTLIILLIGYLAMRKSSKAESAVKGRAETNEVIEEHPFGLNPILWIIFIATFFMGIVIFYYATSFY